MINYLVYLLLGMIQGFTEPIPVSSSGHLLIIKKIIDAIVPVDINFELLAIFTNFGSFLAIFFIFRKTIFKLISSFLGYIFKKDRSHGVKDDFNYCINIIIATIPAGIMGIVVSKLGIFDFLEENVRFVGVMLVFTAFFLWFIKDFKGMHKEVTLKDAIVIGLFQVVALIPGISRSGATIVGGMMRGVKREQAFDFSFMLYMPITVATLILGVKDALEIGLQASEIGLYTIAIAASAVMTYYATLWFRNIVKEGKLIYFSIYCLILGFFVMIIF